MSLFAHRAARPVFRAVATAALLVACGGAEPRSLASVDALATKVEIAEFAGGEAARCVFSAPGLEICAWRVAEGDAAWAALADAGASGDLNFLCELPIDGSPRADGSCRAYARGSEVVESGGLPPVGAAGSLEGRRDAERRLGEALTVRALSQLIGDAPERCRTGGDVQTCEWSLSAGAAAYALVASLVDDAGSGSAVLLRCVVPLDGSARAADSCAAAWADSNPVASDS